MAQEYQNGGRKRSLRRKTKGGGKWSAKYKKSIDCSAPRGFSQRQYCKYGRRKTAKKKMNNQNTTMAF